MDVFRIEVTVPESGKDEGMMIDLLDGFYEVRPDLGAAASQNTEEDTLTVAVALEAEGVDQAVHKSVEIFVGIATSKGLAIPSIVRVTAERVLDENLGDSEPRLAAVC